MQKHLIATLMLGGLTMGVSGCTDHYRVTDPASGKAYYTTKVSDAGRAGAVRITDEKTGSIVTLQSSEVKKISEEEYEAAKAESARPLPVQAAPIQSAPPHAAPAQP